MQPLSEPTDAPPGMDPTTPEAQVLRTADAWLQRGQRVWLATVLHTYGSAPRPVGSMAAINAAGQVIGSVSGGCVEDDLAEWLGRDALACERARLLTYGRDAEERARLRLPCNGHIEIWLEPAEGDRVRQLRDLLAQGLLVRRRIDLRSGVWTLQPAHGTEPTGRSGDSHFDQVLGPTHRLVLVGAAEVSRYLAPLAMTLGFRVEVIDPRQEYLSTWPHAGCTLHARMPDDVLAEQPPDGRTAVVALSHDPKIDDLALLEALPSAALYVGAMGSLRTTRARKQRLATFDLKEEHLSRLHGPVGADIGARTPPEIAVAIAADLVAALRGRSPVPALSAAQAA